MRTNFQFSSDYIYAGYFDLKIIYCTLVRKNYNAIVYYTIGNIKYLTAILISVKKVDRLETG